MTDIFILYCRLELEITERRKFMRDIFITTENIKLDQFLKLANIIGAGGEARLFIGENSIFVNGEPEDRRGKKLRNGDMIKIKNDEYRIVQNGEKR